MKEKTRAAPVCNPTNNVLGFPFLHLLSNKGKPVKQCKLTSQAKMTKQQEEKYKNTNKMSDVIIMKKIIIQKYNNLQVLWSSKVKFVSLSQLLGCPLFGSNSGLFTVPDFIVSRVGIRKKKKKGGKEKI